MSRDKQDGNLSKLSGEVSSIEIVQHPPEILELDEETVAIARAKFAGVDFDGIYGDEDRKSPELIVKMQGKKIRRLFQTTEQLREAFSSEQNRTQAMKDLTIDGIDLQFVKSYCQMKQWSFTDDAEALIRIGFDGGKPNEANA